MSEWAQWGYDLDGLSMLSAALRWAKHGYPVFPVNGKAPLTPHGYKDASKDPATIAAWWGAWPQAGIGIPRGPASGIIVLDFDPRNFENENTVEEFPVELPDTLTV